MSKHWKRFAAVVVSLTMAFQFCVNDFYAYAETNAPEQETVEQTPTEQQTQPEPEVTTEPVETPAQTEPAQEPAPEVETEPTTPPEQEQPQQPAQEETPAQPERESAGTLKLEFKDEEGNTLKTVDPIALTNKYVGDTIRLTDLGVDTNVADYTLVDIKDKNDGTKDYNPNSVEFTLTKNVTELQLVYRENPKEPETAPTENNTNTTEDSQQGEAEEDSEADADEADTEEEDSEEPAEEETEESEEEVEMPTMALSAVASDGAIVTVMVPEGSLPEGSEVVVEKVESDSVAQTVEAVLNEEDQTLTDYKAYDITIIDKDGNEIQPEKNVQVSITGAQVSGETKSVFHIDDSQAVEKVAETTVANTSMFSASGFSIYVVAGSKDGVSSRTITPQKRTIRVGETIQLTTDEGSWIYNHGWTTSDADEPINNQVVYLSNGSRNGVSVTGKKEGTVTIIHTWGRSRETIVIRVEGVVDGDNQQYDVYVYSLVPGKQLDDPSLTPNQLWNGMGKGKVSGVKSPNSYANATVIPAGSYSYIPPQSNYPNITVDGTTYSYDPSGNKAETYSIEVLRLVTAGGANAGNNGYNETVDTNTPTFHLDTRIVLHDTDRMQVGFHLKKAGSNVFELDEATNLYYDKGIHESEITQPNVEDTVTLHDGTVWKFSGWFKDEDCTEPANFDGTLTENQDYWGKYEQVGEYTVTYWDGTKLFDEIAPNPDTYDIYEAYEVKGDGSIHDNSEKHVLIGWVTEEGKKEFLQGQGNHVINDRKKYEEIINSDYFRAFGKTYNEEGIKDKDNINLYAVWAMNTIVDANITVKYDGNGATSGDVPVDDNEYYADSVVTVKSNEGNLVKAGYTFEGWTLEKDGEEVVEKTIDLSTIQTIQDGGTELTLHAKWEQKEGTFRYNLVLPNADWSEGAPAGFTQNGSSGTGGSFWEDSIKYEYPDQITVTNSAPRCDGYVFLGWFDKSRTTDNDSSEAAIRGAGTGFTYLYDEKSDNNTYTLDALWASIGAEDKTFVYDGQSHSIDPAELVFSAKQLNAGDASYDEEVAGLVQIGDVKYSTEENGTYTTTIPALTNVDEYTIYVQAELIVGGQTKTVTTSANLTITARPVTFTGESGERTYKGTEYNLTDVTTNQGKDTGLVGGHTHNVTASASGTNKGEYPGTITSKEDVVIKDADQNDVTKNYDITTVAGKLTITAIENKITITADSSEKVYDGTALTDDGFTYTEGVLLDGDVLTAVVEGSATNVGDAGVNKVTSYKVMRGSLDVTDSYTFADSVDGKLTIKARPVTFTGESGTKTYKGTEYNLTDVTTNQGKDTGLVGGHTHNVTASASGTNKGEYPGTITSKEDVVIKDADQNDVTKNYDITTVAGKLTITAIENKITITADSSEKVYDGTALTDDGFTYTEGVLLDGDVLVVVTKGEITDVGTTDNVIESYKVVNTKLNIDVTDSYQFADSVNGTLEVTPAQLTVNTQSGSKVYDGTALTAHGSIEGLVNNETATLNVTGSQTNVGSSKNIASIVWDGTADENNYQVTNNFGTLIVISQSINPTDPTEPTPDPDDPDNPDPDQPVYTGAEVNDPSDEEYDGNAHQWKPTVISGNATLTEGTDYTVTYSTNDFTNVTGTITVTIKGTGNYRGTVTRTYQITPRQITLTSAGGTKTYDGTALTNGTVTLTGELVDPSDITYRATGTQTEVGSSLNTIVVNYASDQMRANYEVTLVTGTLTVNAAPVTPTTPTTPGGGEGTGTTPATGGPVAAADDDADAEDEPEEEEVEDEETPLSDGEEEVDEGKTPLAKIDVWALINLIAAIITVLFGLILLLSKRHKNDDEEDEEERQARIERGEEKEQEQKRGWICKVLGVLVAIGSVVLFILTEDMSLPMAMTDEWTIWMVIIAVVELVLLLVGRHWKDVDDDEEEQAQA